MEAAARPLPRLDTTPPVTNMYLVILESPQSTALLVRSPARCQRLSTGARPGRLECQIRSRVREAVRALRVARAARAPFWRTVEETRRDMHRVRNACDSSIE